MSHISDGAFYFFMVLAVIWGVAVLWRIVRRICK